MSDLGNKEIFAKNLYALKKKYKYNINAKIPFSAGKA